MEIINVPLEIKADDSRPGFFSGYGAVFNNKDYGDDIILPGAFEQVRKTQDGKVRIALYHNLQLLVGKAEFKQDERGLHLEGQINMNVSYAKDAYELMKDGTLDGMSVGFNILKGGVDWGEDDEGDRVRLISKAELWEVSIVPFGMNPEALVDNVKSDINTIRDFESFLHKSGYNRSEAKAIASRGYKALQRDAGASFGADEMSVDDVKSLIAGFNI